EILTIKDKDGNEKKVVASELFKELNKTEESLNQWGYSLRSGEETVTLARWNYCLPGLQAQAKEISDQISKEFNEIFKGEKPWSDMWAAVKKEWEDNAPSWEEIQEMADDKDFQVYAPQIPVYQPPSINFKPVEVNFKKEKSKRIAHGGNKSFAADLFAYYKAGASKLEAVGEAGVYLNVQIHTAYKGELARYSYIGRTPGTGPLEVTRVISFFDGKKVDTKPVVKMGLLSESDRINNTISKSANWRFSVLGIPMAAEVGGRGEVGFKWDIRMAPFNVGFMVGPYCALDAFANLGADIGIAGAGVGGLVKIVEASLMLQGHGIFEYEDDPRVKLLLSLDTELKMLSGELYAYGYIGWGPLKKEGRYSFFDWKGIQKIGNLYKYEGLLTKRGLVARGNLDPEDILESNQLNEEVYVANLEELAAEKFSALKEVSSWIVGEQNSKTLANAKAIESVATAQSNRIDSIVESLL
ncbi:MAG: hypothetical protein M3Q07_13620, partial [Pseudobdellovibrionaceae bacterium]|nr:hypothetical protein [Pseudobdellovibrionaceae bacterium]